MDDKMKVMIREILFYALLLFFLLVVINGQQDTDSYRQNASIISRFNKYLKKDVSNAVFYLDRCAFGEMMSKHSVNSYREIRFKQFNFTMF